MKKIIIETVLFSIVLFSIYIVLAIFLADELELLSNWATENLGYTGVFLFVYIVDTFPIPIAIPDLVFPLTSHWNRVLLISTMSLASILAGITGLFITRQLAHVKLVQDAILHYRKKGEHLIKKYGIWAIVIAGITPIPYSTMSWIAGVMNMSYKHFLLASLIRIPRFIIYYMAIQAGFFLIS